MAYATAEARQDLLDAVAEAADHLAVAVAALGDAFEALDEQSGDRLEEELFRPAQHAYGRAKRAHSEFAERHGLPGRAFAAAGAGAPSQGVKGHLERARGAAGEAELTLTSLQDTMLPVEVGDPDLRAGLAEVRELIGPLPERTDAFVSGYGR